MVKKQSKTVKSKSNENSESKSSVGDKQDTMQSKQSKISEGETKTKKKASKTEATDAEDSQNNNNKNKKHKKPAKSDSKISDTVFDDSCSEPIPKSPSKNSKTGVEKEEIPDIISLESQPENERIYDLYWSNGTDKFCILKGDDAEFQRAVKVCVSYVYVNVWVNFMLFGHIVR